MQRISLSLLLTVCLWPVAAHSQSQCSIPAGQSCACALPLAALQNGVFGTLEPAGAEVLVTQATGSATIAAPQNLSVGDNAVVIEGGGAVLQAGPSCSLSLPAQSSLTIRTVDGCACASLVEAEEIASVGGQGLHVPGHVEGADGTETGGGGGGAGVGGLVAAGVVAGGVGAAIYFIQQNSGDSVSP